MRYFFYGTLMDKDVLRRVFGSRRLAGLRREVAVLRGFRRVGIKGASYPTIIAAPGATVSGLLVGPVLAAEADLLARYEGSAYVRRRVRVATEAGGHCQAFTFLCLNRTRAAGGDWQLDAWQRRAKPHFLARIRAWVTNPC